MRIVFILPGGGRSGGVRSTVTAANHLLSRGHQVRFLCHRPPVSARNRLRRFLVKAVYPGTNDWLDCFRGPISTYQDITAVQFGPEEIIVGIGMWCSAQLGRLASVSNPKLQYIRGLTPWMPELMDVALSLPLPKVVVSNAVAEQITTRYEVDSLIEVVHNGINDDEYFPCVADELRNGVGTIYADHAPKDPATIRASLGRLAAMRPDIPQYVFGIPRRPKAIRPSVYRRYPSVEQARELYSRSLVWILASRSEGLPGSVLEAMACGCVVVSTDCGGSRDIIVDGENGFLVNVGDVDAIVDRTRWLLSDQVLRGRLREASRRTVRGFTWTASVDRLERVLMLLDSSAPDRAEVSTAPSVGIRIREDGRARRAHSDAHRTGPQSSETRQ